MKNLLTYIKESVKPVDDITSYYQKIADFKDNQKLILCFVNEDGYAEPMKVVVKKNGNDIMFANLDDDRDLHDWKDFVNTTDDSFKEEKNPQVAVAKNMKEAEAICEFYNTFVDM